MIFLEKMSRKWSFKSIRSACEKTGSKIVPFIFFSVPLLPKASSILIISYVLISLLGFSKGYFRNLWERKDFLVYMVLYILLLLGLTYTIDSETGMSKIQTQFSLFIIPLILGGQRLNGVTRQKCLKYFIVGLGVATVLCLGNALYRGISTGSFYVLDEFDRPNNIFFYREFSGLLDLHPTYFSLYLGVGLFCLMDSSFLKRKLNLSIKIFSGVLFFMALFLTSSKAGIFSFIAVALVFYAYKIIVKRRMVHFGFLIMFILGVVVMYGINPVFYKRSAQGLTSFDQVFFENKFINESTSIRFHLWLLSLKTAKESFVFGYGTGSTREILNQKCLKFYAFSTCETLRNKNSHNQFLNFLVSNGIIFVFGFILALAIGLTRAFQKRDKLLILFLLLMSLNFLFESLLQRERGVVFFMLFVVMLSISDRGIQVK